MFEGWMGGVGHWNFFSGGFQHDFTFFKALDPDFDFCIVLCTPIF
jgi:hypothetical protein